MPDDVGERPEERVREREAPRADSKFPSVPAPEADDLDFERDRRERPPRPEDEQHLNLLSIFYYVVGALCGLCACLPIFHFAIGVGMITGSFPAGKGAGPPPPPALGWIFVLAAGAAMAAGWALAVGLVVAGYMLRRRRAYVFCLVMAGFAMLQQPFGTVLGVFTIIVLLRPSVKQLFGRGAPAATAG